LLNQEILVHLRRGNSHDYYGILSYTVHQV
jgi:hypothetical protein